jgi:hypothetical protein
MNMHTLLVSCLVAAYVAANVYAIVELQVFELARSRKHLLLYGVAFRKRLIFPSGVRANGVLCFG